MVLHAKPLPCIEKAIHSSFIMTFDFLLVEVCKSYNVCTTNVLCGIPGDRLVVGICVVKTDLYVLRVEDKIEVYDATGLSFKRHVNVAGMFYFNH